MTPEAWLFAGTAITALLGLIGSIVVARSGKPANDAAIQTARGNSPEQRLWVFLGDALDRIEALEKTVTELRDRADLFDTARDHIAELHTEWGRGPRPIIPARILGHMPEAVQNLIRGDQ